MQSENVEEVEDERTAAEQGSATAELEVGRSIFGCLARQLICSQALKSTYQNMKAEHESLVETSTGHAEDVAGLETRLEQSMTKIRDLETAVIAKTEELEVCLSLNPLRMKLNSSRIVAKQIDYRRPETAVCNH
jgi:uncharacterized sporulation protein YeaH/YhbH (DUF444 family)